MESLPSLLVSVRSAAEAQAALAGGASLIDVKEPRRGSLGPAPMATVRAVLRTIGGRRPVSAAFGELMESPVNDRASSLAELAGLTYAKCGLAGCGVFRKWQDLLARAGKCLRQGNRTCQPVAVVYADWQRAHAPRPEQVLRFVQEHGWHILLVDTWKKDGTTLLDWLPPPALVRIRQWCREGGIRMALAGSLGASQIRVLLPLAPDWFAVRGAVCHQSRREAGIDAKAVARLAGLLQRTRDQKAYCI
jgi:uncharacterized protein (UPF0264 family)